jgi:Ca2+-binding EF-hand superfamily protein
MMLPILKNEVLNSEDNVEDFRKMFREADIDGSGYLTVDELYSVVQKMGADVTQDDIIQLMSEIDVDRNGQIDVDEFMALMSMGDEMNF